VVHTPKVGDWEFSEKLIKEYKVATIPLSPFYLKSREGEGLLRFCFAKKNETIRQAMAQMKDVSF